MGRLVRIDNQPESSRTCLRAILWTGQDSLDQGMSARGLSFGPARIAWIRACLPAGYLSSKAGLPWEGQAGNQAVNLPGENCLKAGAKEIRQ